MRGIRSTDTPMDPNVKLDRDEGKVFDDPGKCRRW